MNLDETFPALSENRQPPEPAFSPLCFVFVSDIAGLCNKLSRGTTVSLALSCPDTKNGIYFKSYVPYTCLKKLHALHKLSRTRFLQVVVILVYLMSKLHWRIQTLSFLSLSLPAFLPSAILFFLTQNSEGGPGPLP